MAHTPVIAAIPNYNMAGSLAELLPQVLAQGYDAVYVLDDHSTDDSVQVAQGFAGVEVIAGKENLGASGNRNRILAVKKRWPEAIIHFIDADMRLISQDNPARIRQLLRDPTIGVLGGLVRLPNGRQSPYNFGPRMSLKFIVSAMPQHWAYFITAKSSKPPPDRPADPRREWPDITAQPMPQDAYFVLEGNMCIRMKMLESVGGFHPTLRYNEAQDLSDKIIALGLRVRFDPIIATTHLAIDVRGAKRYREGVITALKVLHKNRWPVR